MPKLFFFLFAAIWIAIVFALAWRMRKAGALSGSHAVKWDDEGDSSSRMIGGVDVTDFNSPNLP